jgi:hypothetical protein
MIPCSKCRIHHHYDHMHNGDVAASTADTHITQQATIHIPETCFNAL